jgi:hypothetical protein
MTAGRIACSAGQLVASTSNRRSRRYFGRSFARSSLSNTDTSAPSLHPSAAASRIMVTRFGARLPFELRELVAYTLQQWPLTVIEEALGRDAMVILPPALRTRTFTVRLPQYQIGALQVLADDGRESVEAMLMRMFEELADLNQERLSRLIPGLAEAIAWPEAGEGDRVLRATW